MKTNNVSIVTGCDLNYLWGVFLLVASIQKAHDPVDVVVFGTGFDSNAEKMISQFPVATVVRDDSDNKFSLNNRKPTYMLQSDSDYIAWVDADCIITGPSIDLLIPANQQFQVRLRSEEENASVFLRYYRPEDKWGAVPNWVKERWRDDVGGRQLPRVDTTCPSNCFVIHNRHLPFIKEWEDLINRVLDPGNDGPIDKGNPAYWMTDESTLNALLLFSEKCPDPGRYQLDNLQGTHLVHFIGSPKPWIGWNRRFLYCIPKVIDLLDWLQKEGFAIPPVPSSFRRWRIPYSYAEAHARGAIADVKSAMARKIFMTPGRLR